MRITKALASFGRAVAYLIGVRPRKLILRSKKVKSIF